MSRQILLIDDSAILRRIVAGALGAQPARYEVVSATRASEGFARACGGEAVVILMDERMAGPDETGLCRRLLDEPRTAEVPVVLMTGRHADASKRPSLPVNVVEVLSKPFAPEQLVNIVNTIAALGKRNAGFAEMRRSLSSYDSGRETVPLTDQPLPSDMAASTGQPVCAATSPLRPGETAVRSAVQAVTSEGTTGVLRFCPADSVATEVLIENGRLLLVTTRDGAAYSHGAAEYLSAKVSPATLQDAVAEQVGSGIPFLLSLGARGLVSKAAGVALLRRLGQRQFARLWTVPARSLQISFEPLEALPGYTLRLEPVRETMDEWLLDTLRLLTNVDIASETRHQGLVGTPRLLRRYEATVKVLELDEAEQAFIRQIDGRRDLPTIARNLGVTPEAAFLLVHRFRCLELLEYRPAPLPFVVTPRTNMRRVLPLHR